MSIYSLGLLAMPFMYIWGWTQDFPFLHFSSSNILKQKSRSHCHWLYYIVVWKGHLILYLSHSEWTIRTLPQIVWTSERFHEYKLSQKNWICIPKMEEAEGYLVCCFRELKVICFIVHGYFCLEQSCEETKSQLFGLVHQIHILLYVQSPTVNPKWDTEMPLQLYLLTLIHNKKLESVRSYLETCHAFNFSVFAMWLLTILFPYILPNYKLKKEKYCSTYKYKFICHF